MAQPTVTVDCPTCGRRVEFAPSSRWRPFCSERCRTVDLGAWASERYRIAGDAPDDASDETSVSSADSTRPERG